MYVPDCVALVYRLQAGVRTGLRGPGVQAACRCTYRTAWPSSPPAAGGPSPAAARPSPSCGPGAPPSTPFGETSPSS